MGHDYKVGQLKPVISSESNQNTDGSSVLHKKDDNSRDFKGMNVNIFEVSAHENKVENQEQPRSNFFDLPNFGPTKKRSSTDPKRFQSMTE